MEVKNAPCLLLLPIVNQIDINTNGRLINKSSRGPAKTEAKQNSGFS